MNLLKKEFKGNYDRADFYARTGMYFAEKKYRREMPYLINTDEKQWCLFYQNDTLAGFYAWEEKDDITVISGFYVTESFRRLGVSEYLLTDIMEHFSAVRMTTCSQHLIKLLVRRSFERVSIRGSYLTMEWYRDKERN